MGFFPLRIYFLNHGLDVHIELLLSALIFKDYGFLFSVFKQTCKLDEQIHFLTLELPSFLSEHALNSLELYIACLTLFVDADSLKIDFAFLIAETQFVENPGELLEISYVLRVACDSASFSD